MQGVKICGVGYAQAQRKVTNEDLSKIVDTNDEWIVQRTGIHARNITENENTSDLAYRASLAAIEDAGISGSQIDAIVCATLSADCLTPSCASLVQGKLGLTQPILAFDLNAACSGFMYGLEVASHLLETYQTILVIGAETLSKLMDWTDRNTCVLFGDGAGAAILQRGDFIPTFYADSQPDMDGALQVQGRSLSQPLTNSSLQGSYISMKGKDVFRFAVGAMQKAMESVLEQRHLDWSDVDLIIPHQANQRIIANVARRVGVPIEKFYINLDRFGNTSAASIAIALATAKEEGRLQAGMRILCVGFGGGLTSGAMYFKW